MICAYGQGTASGFSQYYPCYSYDMILYPYLTPTLSLPYPYFIPTLPLPYPYLTPTFFNLSWRHGTYHIIAHG